MLRKQIVATNSVDRQKEAFEDEALYQFAESINLDSSVMRMGLNHDISIMPVGKVIKGTVINLQDHSLAIEAQIDDFISDFRKIEGPDNQILYSAESTLDKRPFKELEADAKDKITVSISPLNYSTHDYEEIIYVVTNECDALVENTIKKSFIPDPEIVVHVLMGTMIYLTTKNTVNKLSEKLADSFSDDVVKIYENLKKTIFSIGKKVLGSKETTYVLTEPEQPIELVIKTSNPEDVLYAIESAADGYILSQTEKYSCYFNGDLKKIQYLYNNETNNWEVNYMVTNTGQVVGTEKNYRKAVKLYNTIINTPGAGFSVGGTVTNEQTDNV